MAKTATANLRKLPSVDEVLRTVNAGDAVKRFGRAAVVGAVRRVIAESRANGGIPSKPDEVTSGALALLQAQVKPKLRPVFNLTGTVLHTNLGRAVLAEVAIEAAVSAMRSAVTLEFDLENGRRGERDDHLRGLLCELTGAEDATVVNNNAAAVLIVLNTLAHRREAIVSRGELIEIGGAFRMPEIMSRAGTKLVEVGTTNRTHKKDYVGAIGAKTGIIFKVHTSNYRIEGFTKEVSARELATLASERKIPMVHDLGSGTLVDLAWFGLAHEPTVAEAIADGADIVTFSGDKLLGGPQAGFIVGRKDLIVAINRNPMKRALRLDKMRIAAIEATLKLYRDPDRLAQRLPTVRLLSLSQSAIEACSRRLLPDVQAAVGPLFSVEVTACESQIGSGALPLVTVPSAGLAIRPLSVRGAGHLLKRLAGRLRDLDMPVVGRIEEQALLLDLRCLDDERAFARNLESLDLSEKSNESI
ncbi:L-seryl-tRNA(Sec) selenium transferase [Tardiphaga sp. 42S5]|uniref:L-seryl-tRNA(Sec) selenium transferase n=1 Tax=Tardiphaga sp. 42S5 TaxID=1404799 RepID=UPI002A5A23E9|nr:L-seryl-tRNA(Sec) selenium transferase [Tardiphaga sp. 42S5]WPO43772.1 L-seryl-tRNA(Sec) selenium transferase [Tardiphaga sp. 42S5]